MKMTTKWLSANDEVAGVRPDIVLVAVFPAMAPGLIVQFPAGSTLKVTLPVATAHVGCVMAPAPIVGAAGVAGWALITTFAEGSEVQPEALVMV